MPKAKTKNTPKPGSNLRYIARVPASELVRQLSDGPAKHRAAIDHFVAMYIRRRARFNFAVNVPDALDLIAEQAAHKPAAAEKMEGNFAAVLMLARFYRHVWKNRKSRTIKRLFPKSARAASKREAGR